MKLGMIGLGRMGANITERLIRNGHEVVVYDQKHEAIQSSIERGAIGATSPQDIVQQLAMPRVIWLMVPAGEPVDENIAALLPHLTSGDIIVDGGNSFYKDTLRRAAILRERGLYLVDVGTSGGIWGLTEGYSLMIGGDRAAAEPLSPLFKALAPSPDHGWGYVGPSGAGHFTKMVHNGIEYGMMQALAEGFSILRKKDALELDLHQVAEIWRYGSVVRSWLLDLISQALSNNPDLKDIAPYVEDSGEGRWTVFEAIDLDVPAPVISLSLLQRLRSRDTSSFADKLLAALRHEFGGHATKQEK
ncbi:MAG: decarboxylating 6-phosphogluconate dehydrogenase [Chloroflexi bacterium]|nr:decarboxylating 6-phosphogluconate dehydrogenase [Chloroflexota bacterium]